MRLLRFAIALCLSSFSLFASAGEIEPYEQRTFDILTSARKPVVLAIYANWCPTCKAQKVIQTELMALPEYKKVTMLLIDFDSQKSLLKTFNVGIQSTMVAFKAGKEVGRSVGDTSREGIEGLIMKTLD
jgi:thioredoxin-like negative regulator of GroEL